MSFYNKVVDHLKVDLLESAATTAATTAAAVRASGTQATTMNAVRACPVHGMECHWSAWNVQSYFLCVGNG